MTDWPVNVSNCADCGVGTIQLGEWYMVSNDVWEQAWRGRRKWWHGRVPGQEILCISCLEQRLGRTLTASDFTDVSANDPNKDRISERMRDRLAAVDFDAAKAKAPKTERIKEQAETWPPDRQQEPAESGGGGTMTDDPSNTSSFRYADRRIADLLNKLKGKGVCGCCASRAMVQHAVMLCEAMMGSKVTAELFSALAESVRENNIPAPDYEARH